MRNPLRMWMTVPIGISLTVFLFWTEVVEGGVRADNYQPGFFGELVMKWFSQNPIHLAGQWLTVEFILIGILVLYLENFNKEDINA